MKKVFALAAFALMGAAVVTFNACSDDPEASPLTADLSSAENTVLLKGNVYYAQDSLRSRNATTAGTTDTLAKAPEGVYIVVQVPYSGANGLGLYDASGTPVPGNWTTSLTTDANGEFSLRVPVNAQYAATNVTIIAEKFAAKQKGLKNNAEADGIFAVTGYTIGVEGAGTESSTIKQLLKGNLNYHVTIKYLNGDFTKTKSPVIY